MVGELCDFRLFGSMTCQMVSDPAVGSLVRAVSISALSFCHWPRNRYTICCAQRDSENLDTIPQAAVCIW
jgi:hypothetical protein